MGKANLRISITAVIMISMVLFTYQNCAKKLQPVYKEQATRTVVVKEEVEVVREVLEELTPEERAALEDTIRATLITEVTNSIQADFDAQEATLISDTEADTIVSVYQEIANNLDLLDNGTVAPTITQYNELNDLLNAEVNRIITEIFNSLNEQGISLEIGDLENLEGAVETLIIERLSESNDLAAAAEFLAMQVIEDQRRSHRKSLEYTISYSNACAVEENSAVSGEHGVHCWGSVHSYSVPTRDNGENPTNNTWWGYHQTTFAHDGAANYVAGPTAPSLEVGGVGVSLMSTNSQGATSACAIIDDVDHRSLKCWGYDGYGQLGNDDIGHLDGSSNYRFPPRNSILPNSNWSNESVISVDGGYLHACAIVHSEKAEDANGNRVGRGDVPGGGNLYCWGYNNYSQVGQPPSSGSGLNTTNRHTPYLTWDMDNNNFSGDGLLAEGVVDVSAGSHHTCAIKHTVGVHSDHTGDLYCWGYNGYSQTGNGLTANVSRPATSSNVFGALTNVKEVVKVSAGHHFTCAIVNEATGTGDDQMWNKGELYCWGWNNYGQLGRGYNTDSAAERKRIDKVIGIPDPVIDIAVGYEGACAVTSRGAVYCWGRNNQKQLGPINSDQYSPIPMAYMQDSTISIKTHPYAHSFCAKKSNDNIYCWGYNHYGSFNQNDGSETERIPRNIKTSLLITEE